MLQFFLPFFCFQKKLGSRRYGIQLPHEQKHMAILLITFRQGKAKPHHITQNYYNSNNLCLGQTQMYVYTIFLWKPDVYLTTTHNFIFFNITWHKLLQFYCEKAKVAFRKIPRKGGDTFCRNRMNLISRLYLFYQTLSSKQLFNGFSLQKLKVPDKSKRNEGDYFKPVIFNSFVRFMILMEISSKQKSDQCDLN